MLGFDLESTSAEPITARPVSFALCHFDAGQMVKTRYALIDPEMPIPEESTRIHGITDEMVKERGGSLENSVVGIAGELVAADAAGTPIVGCNITFDLTIIDACLRRIEDGVGLREVGFQGNCIDCQVVDRRMDKFRRGSRTLLALCAHYGVDLGGAHNAAADATASVRVALALAEKYPEVGGIEPYLLHAQQKAWRAEWAVDFARYRAEKGQEPLEESAGDWPLIGERSEVASESAQTAPGGDESPEGDGSTGGGES